MCSRPWQILITSELWAHSIKSIGSFFSGGYEAERPIKKTHHLSLSPLPDMGSALAARIQMLTNTRLIASSAA